MSDSNSNFLVLKLVTLWNYLSDPVCDSGGLMGYYLSDSVCDSKGLMGFKSWAGCFLLF